jgi:hypothetical protein
MHRGVDVRDVPIDHSGHSNQSSRRRLKAAVILQCTVGASCPPHIHRCARPPCNIARALSLLLHWPTRAVARSSRPRAPSTVRRAESRHTSSRPPATGQAQKQRYRRTLEHDARQSTAPGRRMDQPRGRSDLRNLNFKLFNDNSSLKGAVTLQASYLQRKNI